MRLRSKILSFSLPLILVPFLLISLAVYFFIVRSYDFAERTQTSIRLKESLAGLNDIVKQTDQQISFFANTPSIKRYLISELDKKSTIEEKETASSLLQTLLDRDPYLLDVSLLNSKGDVVLSSTKLNKTQKKIIDSDALAVFRRSVVARVNQAPAVRLDPEIYATVHSGTIESDRFLGLVKFVLDSRAYATPLRARILEGMSLVCFDDRGTIWLSLPARPVRRKNFDQIDWNNTPVFSEADDDQTAVSPGEAGGDYRVYMLPIRRFDTDISMSLIKGESWRLGVVEPVITPPGLRAFQLTFAGIILFSIIGVIWMSAISARRIVRPIEEVSRATARIAKGEKDLDLDITTGDEVEDLADAVIYMNQELKEYQAQLVESARMAAMGEMTSEISHEIQNRISGVSLWLQHLDSEVDEGDERREYIDEMNLGLAGFIDMLSGLKQFYRKPDMRKGAFDFAELLTGAVSFAGVESDERNVSLRLDVRDESFIVLGDKEQLKSVVLNLLLNAIEASPKNGTVVITCEKSETKLLVSVKDSGPGIPEQDLERVFYPFFTTKASGSGLGLAIAKNVVAAHGGRIEVQSTEGSGTAFTLRLPLGNGADRNNPGVKGKR